MVIKQFDGEKWIETPPKEAVEKLIAEFERLREENDSLKDIVTSFSYFEIRLEHERMLAESDCGRDGRCCGGGAACKSPDASEG